MLRCHNNILATIPPLIFTFNFQLVMCFAPTSIVTQVTNRMNKMDKDTTQEKPEVIRAYSSMEENVPPATNGIINSSVGDLTSRNHSSRFENSSESGSNSDGVEKKPNYHQTLSMDDDIAANGGSISSTSQSSTSLIKLSFYLLLGGTILGLILPQNPNLPSPTWQILSNIVGYTYFLAWSASFYPQICLNYQRQTTRGLSVDFCVLNVLGYICYTIYTTNFYWNEAVIRAYKDRIPAGDNNEDDMEDGTDAVSDRSVTVQGNDVAFAIHAILMASITLSQIGLYDTFVVRPPSRRVNFVLVATITFVIFYLISTKLIQGQVDVLDFLYLLGAIKVGVTIGKYVPQALLNRSRKSTVGWNVWNVILDLTGGILSLLQLIGDCASMKDWTGITGNPAKIALSLVTIFFDFIFLVQHYILYPEIDDGQSYSPLPAIQTPELKS